MEKAGMIYGSEVPRIYTPPLRELTPDTTLGFEVIEFAENVLNINLHPWQKWLVIHALEVIDDPEDGWRLRFKNVQVLVARQNGKTTLSCVIALYFLYQLEVALVLGTAQDVSNAEDVWQHVVDMAQENEVLAESSTSGTRTGPSAFSWSETVTTEYGRRTVRQAEVNRPIWCSWTSSESIRRGKPGRHSQRPVWPAKMRFCGACRTRVTVRA